MKSPSLQEAKESKKSKFPNPEASGFGTSYQCTTLPFATRSSATPPEPQRCCPK